MVWSWRAILTNGTVVDADASQLRLADLLVIGDQVAQFHWQDESGKAVLGVSVPPRSRLVAFRRCYVSTDDSQFEVFAVGWETDGKATIAFLQPDGLVEVSQDREFATTFERSLAVGV